MSEYGGRKNVFISHHHADDASVDKLQRLMRKAGYDIRNSSIRAKPANQARLDRGEVKDETIRRLLRRKISWAGQVVVLIGKRTHERRWVDWEINHANRKGKRIIGVYEQGGTEADIPPALEKYGSAIVGWQSKGIFAALDGSDTPFELPDGTPRAPTHARTSVKC